MFVLVQSAAESVASSYVEVRDLAWIGQRRGQWAERTGVGDALMRSVFVVMLLEFAQGV
jgi:hypothetical protein